MNDQHDPFDELMRRSLADEAAKIEPNDGLHKIQARIRSQRTPAGHRPWMLTLGGAVVGTAAAVGLFSVLSDDSTGTGGGSPEIAGPVIATAAPSAPPSAAPSTAPTKARTAKPTLSAATGPTTTPEVTLSSPEAVTTKAVPVYWVGHSAGNDTGLRLYRTFTRIKGRPAYEAVRMMTTQQADDPDYGSLWSGAQVSSVTWSGDLVTVDFKELPRRRLEPGAADLAVQQLVYTVQGAIGDETRPVRITEHGRTAPALFGVVDTERPMSRAQAADVQAPVWIISPVNQAVTTTPVTVSGVAAAFEAEVRWRAVNLRTKATLSGRAMTKEGQTFSPFAFSPVLTAGEWSIEVYRVSPQDGRTTDTDSKTLIVK
ncbi:MAG TPA: Gmad2 immunoglobulin-like domain-containing protein [Kribbella sp.]|nr:Gmad2 immunoglobulin-like domain-containing protein [Kribbella sp.]